MGEWRFSENLKAMVSFITKDLPVEAGTARLRIREPEGMLQLTAMPRHPLLEGVDFFAGLRRSIGDFPSGGVNAYRRGWTGLGIRLKLGERVRGSSIARYERYSGFDLPGRPDLKGEVSVLLGSTTRLALSARRERAAYDFYRLFLETPYAVPYAGFNKPLDVEREYRAELSRKFSERWVATGSFAWGRWGDLLQWTDIPEVLGSSIPSCLRMPQSLREVDFKRANARLEFESAHNWFAALGYTWRDESDVTGTQRVTDSPKHEGNLSLARKAGKLEATTGLSAASARNAYGNRPGTMGSYVTWNASAKREWNKNISLWAEGKNMLGKRYDLYPGFPAVRMLFTAGIEVVF
jgi:hypothetical protein